MRETAPDAPAVIAARVADGTPSCSARERGCYEVLERILSDRRRCCAHDAHLVTALRNALLLMRFDPYLARWYSERQAAR